MSNGITTATLIDAGDAASGQPRVSAQTWAFYRLLDSLRTAHPEIEFESCSSGGARIDLEVLNRVQRVWVSDNLDPQDRQRMLWWTAQLVPTELLGSHIASGRSHTTGRWHDFDVRAATAVFGHFGIEWDLTEASADDHERFRGWIIWYKERRALLAQGRLVRVDLPDPGVYFKGVVTDDHALFSLFAELPTTAASLGRLRFPGLALDRSYRVTMLDLQTVAEPHHVPWARETSGLVLTGRQLAEAGLRAPYLQPSGLVLFEARAEPAGATPGTSATP
ncbi:MAG: alpha-galactosidase [Propioniciclava sp.]